MFKHTVSYKDFNGQDRKEELFFHLSVPEVTRLEAEIGGPLEDHIRELQADQKLDKLLAFLERMMLSSYGKKTLDGKSFHKSEEARKDFEYSNAYAELFEEMLTNPELSRRFGESVSDNGKARKKNTAQLKVIQESPVEPTE